MKYKLRKAEDEIVKLAIEGVKYARNFTDDVEFSPEDARNMCIRFLFAGLIASPAASISFFMHRARPHITGPFTLCAMDFTAAKSPGEDTGKPASITSTLRRTSCPAISSFSCDSSEAPGDCSPSRNVVSNIIIFSMFSGALHHLAILSRASSGEVFFLRLLPDGSHPSSSTYRSSSSPPYSLPAILWRMSPTVCL